MILLITRRLPSAVESRAAREYTVRSLALQGALDQSTVLNNAIGADAILCTPIDRLDAGLITLLPSSVKVIATFSAGQEHIDLSAAAARGIKVCNTPDVGSIATAELALMLMLMAARRGGEGERIVRAGKWGGLAATFHLGTGVAGKTLGIFGMGRIGRELATMARGLNMKIHYRNRTRLDPTLECGATYHDNDQTFLSALDFLSINAPGGQETYRWLNAARIAALKPGAIIVNTGRGSSIDDDALIAALRAGHVASAGLDVFNNEPKLHPGYIELENVVLLPHIGTATAETRDSMGFMALDGIAAALRAQ